MKPRLVYSEVFKPLDLDALEWEKTPLMFNGERVIYAGSHHDSIVWLKHKNGRITSHDQAEVLHLLRLA